MDRRNAAAARSRSRAQARRGGNALLVLVGLLLLVLAGTAIYVLLRPTESQRDRGNPKDVVQTPPEPPLFDGWESPAAVLLFTGEQHGYLEPCGCTAGQTGGLTRRADLVRLLREEKQWPVAGFDLGGALRSERAKRPQEAIKFETTRAALRTMNYDAQALGEEELRFGADQIYNVFSQEQAAGDVSPRFLCANVTLFEERTDQYALEIPEPFRIVPVGTLKVGVTAVVGRSTWRRVFAEGLSVNETLFGFEEPSLALKRVLPQLQAQQPDVLVLLSHAGLDESRDLAAQFPDFNIVVTAEGPEDGRREPGLVGETLILEVGRKGKTAGVVGVFPDSGGERLRFQLVELSGKRFEHSPVIQELFKQYVARLDSEHPNLQESLGPHPRGAEFLGAAACGECHKKAYAVWKNSKHSHAFESLSTGRPDEDPNSYVPRTRDPECLTCHATGWDPQSVGRYDSGFVDLQSTPHLAGNQCENCHGPGSRHAELERAWLNDGGEVTEELVAARREMQLKRDWARENLCVKCHDLDNSPTFDTDAKPFDTYWWPKVEHRGKD